MHRVHGGEQVVAHLDTGGEGREEGERLSQSVYIMRQLVSAYTRVTHKVSVVMFSIHCVLCIMLCVICFV